MLRRYLGWHSGKMVGTHCYRRTWILKYWTCWVSAEVSAGIFGVSVHVSQGFGWVFFDWYKFKIPKWQKTNSRSRIFSIAAIVISSQLEQLQYMFMHVTTWFAIKCSGTFSIQLIFFITSKKSDKKTLSYIQTKSKIFFQIFGSDFRYFWLIYTLDVE